MAFLSQQGKNGELRAFKPEEKRSSWWNDIQTLVKKCWILALYFFPQVSNMCRVWPEGEQSSRWWLHQRYCPIFCISCIALPLYPNRYMTYCPIALYEHQNVSRYVRLFCHVMAQIFCSICLFDIGGVQSWVNVMTEHFLASWIRLE
jgi:hypothetical protein